MESKKKRKEKGYLGVFFVDGKAFREINEIK